MKVPGHAFIVWKSLEITCVEFESTCNVIILTHYLFVQGFCLFCDFLIMDLMYGIIFYCLRESWK